MATFHSTIVSLPRQETEVTSIRLRWEIRLFSWLRPGQNVVSSKFILGGCREFQLNVCKFSSFHQFRLCPLDEITSDFPIHWEFSLVDRHGRRLLVERKSKTLKEDEQNENIIIKELDLKELGYSLLELGSVTVCFILSVDGDLNALKSKATKRKASFIQEENSTKLLRTLSSNFEKLYEDKTDTDCVLKAGDTEFPVHRIVLSARSPVFAAMFYHDTSERFSGEANIVDVEAPILSDVLYYMYSGKIRGLSVDTAVSMFTVADIYAILELREMCLQFLIKNLNLGNICDAALLCHIHREEALEKKVVSFIDYNKTQVLNSDEWKEFLSSQSFVAAKLLTAAYLQRTEEKTENVL